MNNVAIEVLRAEQANTKKVNLTVRIPIPLYERVAAIRIAAERHGFRFAVSDIVQSAITGACDYAEQQLLELASQHTVLSISIDAEDGRQAACPPYGGPQL